MGPPWLFRKQIGREREATPPQSMSDTDKSEFVGIISATIS